MGLILRKLSLSLFAFFVVIILLSSIGARLHSQNRMQFKKAYFFQHRLLPRWTHYSGGKFFNALLNNDLRILNRAATKLLGSEYASKIKVKKYEDMNGILIIFPEPNKVPLCYYAFIMKVEGGYRYLTYEKTFNTGSGRVGYVCEWLPDKSHQSYKSRTYKDAESFIADLKKITGGR